MKAIAFVHQKGGTGKTTACLNIAGCLVKQQKKVLVVDMDPQGSATGGLGLLRNQESSTYQVLMGEEDIRQCIFETKSGVYIVPSAIDLLMIDNRLKHARLLEKHLAKVANYFDAILIDTPAGHTSLIMNAIIAAGGHIIVPSDSGVFAYESLETFNFFLKELAKAYSIRINLMAILYREEFRPQSKNPLKMLAKLWEKHHDSLESHITAFWEKNGIKALKFYKLPYSHQIVQAQIEGLPISHYAPESDIAKIYQQITLRLEETKDD